MSGKTEFDNLADNYHATLNKALSPSGENSEYYANNRIKWTSKLLLNKFSNLKIQNIMDYGCGTGNQIKYF